MFPCTTHPPPLNPWDAWQILPCTTRHCQIARVSLVRQTHLAAYNPAPIGKGAPAVIVPFVPHFILCQSVWRLPMHARPHSGFPLRPGQHSCPGDASDTSLTWSLVWARFYRTWPHVRNLPQENPAHVAPEAMYKTSLLYSSVRSSCCLSLPLSGVWLPLTVWRLSSQNRNKVMVALVRENILILASEGTRHALLHLQRPDGFVALSASST